MTFLCVCAVRPQVPALHPVLHGGGGLHGAHAHASQGQRALQDLRHGPCVFVVSFIYLFVSFILFVRLLYWRKCLFIPRLSGRRPISSATVWSWPTCWRSRTRDSPSILCCWRASWRRRTSRRRGTSSTAWWENTKEFLFLLLAPRWKTKCFQNSWDAAQTFLEPAKCFTRTVHSSDVTHGSGTQRNQIKMGAHNLSKNKLFSTFKTLNLSSGGSLNIDWRSGSHKLLWLQEFLLEIITTGNKPGSFWTKFFFPVRLCFLPKFK